MKVTFFSNFLNHHQLPFCTEMVKILGDDFKFVATEKIPAERIKLGYEDMNDMYDFVVKAYDRESEAYRLGIDSDIVIIGSAPKCYIKKRLSQKKITFRYSERIFKRGFKLKSFFSIFLNCTIKEKKNVYLLCSSAYTAFDYNLAGAYKGKTFKWGYFPNVKEYENIDELISKKEQNSILWVARFLDWKHPEIPLKIAKRLKNEGYNFTINMIGTGELFDDIKNKIIEMNLEDCVNLIGSMSPENVRTYMERSEIFLFTSDKGEGWGAVLNEAMNSACISIASHEIGAVPFLIKDNENGYIYEDGNEEDLYNKIKRVLDDKKILEKIGLNAYKTMYDLWNSKIAANRLMQLSNSLLNNEKFLKYDEGPCSKAICIKDNWYIK